MKGTPARLTKVTIGLPFGLGTAEWESDPTERRAAWSLYVELVTRIATQPFPEGHQGLMREALTSLYSLFPTTREILREAGPDVGGTMPSVGGIAIEVLNRGLRPFLTKWHPRLLHWEAQRPEDVSAGEHEASWPERDAFLQELEALRGELETYRTALATIIGLPKGS